MITNCVISPNPKLYHIYDYISQNLPNSVSLEEDFFPKGKKSDIDSLIYLTHFYCNFILKQHLQKKSAIPADAVTNIVTGVSCDANKMSLVYDLFLYLIYYSQLRKSLEQKDQNTTNNRSMISFFLKVLCGPIVYSNMLSVPKDVVVSQVVYRYNKYLQDGVFSNLHSLLKNKYDYVSQITSSVIQNECDRVYLKIQQYYSQIDATKTLDKCNKADICLLDSNQFVMNNYTSEELTFIIQAESQYRSKGVVDTDIVSKVPVSRLPKKFVSILGEIPTELTNDNLIRYIQENSDVSEKDYVLQLCKNIKNDWWDVDKSQIDFGLITEKIVKAIFVWNITEDKNMAKNYSYFINKINECTLDKSMIVSIYSLGKLKPNKEIYPSILATL